MLADSVKRAMKRSKNAGRKFMTIVRVEKNITTGWNYNQKVFYERLDKITLCKLVLSVVGFVLYEL